MHVNKKCTECRLNAVISMPLVGWYIKAADGRPFCTSSMATACVSPRAPASASDDSCQFLEMMRSSYRLFDDFMVDFKAFQQRSSTCFFIYNSMTAKMYAERYNGRHLKKGFPYYYVRFACVHCVRKKSAVAWYVVFIHYYISCQC